MPIHYDRRFPIRPRLKEKSSYMGERGYLVTINTHSREKYFCNKTIVHQTVEILGDVSCEMDFDVIAYCFMPDHLHLVLTGKSQQSNLQKYISKFKQKSGFLFSCQYKGRKLWAISYHDRVLRKEEAIKNVALYTFRNPVEAGLVEKSIDYPFLGSFVYSIDELSI